MGSSLKEVDPKDMQSSVDCISFGPVGVWNVEMAKSSGQFLGQKKQKKSPPASFERNSCFDFRCERAIDFSGPRDP